MSATQLMTIGNARIARLTHANVPVTTFEMVAEVHGISVETVRSAYKYNRKRFKEGVHQFRLDFATASRMVENKPANRNGLTVLTKKGYLLLVKALTDDVSWEVQTQMVDEYFELLEIQPAAKKGTWLQELLREKPAKFETKFQGEIAAHLNALNEKTRQGVPKLPSDVGSGKVAGTVPNRIREAYLATLGPEVYSEAQRRKKATGAPTTQQFVQDMPLDMMRGLMYGLAVAARSEQHYEDMFDAATKNDQLSMPHRWPVLLDTTELL